MRKRRAPSWAARRFGTQDMVVGQNMSISQRLGGLGVIPYHRGVRTDFRLRKDHADAHGIAFSLLGNKAPSFPLSILPLAFCKGRAQIPAIWIEIDLRRALHRISLNGGHGYEQIGRA